MEENIETPKVSKSSNHLVENAHSKNTNFDQTITLPQKNVPLPAAVNETVVLSKGLFFIFVYFFFMCQYFMNTFITENEDLYNASRSFLEDDQSEVEETPSKIPKPLLKLDIGKNKLFEYVLILKFSYKILSNQFFVLNGFF